MGLALTWCGGVTGTLALRTDTCSSLQQERGCWGILGQLDAGGCCWQEGSSSVAVPLGDCGWTVSLPGVQRLGCLPAGRDACPPLSESAEGSLVSFPLAVVLAAPSSQQSSQCFCGRCRGSAALLACLEGRNSSCAVPAVLRRGASGPPCMPGGTAALQPDCWHTSRTSLALCG